MILSEQVDILEAPIFTDEIAHAIDIMKLDKSPGPDRLTAEFYKKFKNTLLPSLQLLFSRCVVDKELPSSWRKAKLVLLPKPN